MDKALILDIYGQLPDKYNVMDGDLVYRSLSVFRKYSPSLLKEKEWITYLNKPLQLYSLHDIKLNPGGYINDINYTTFFRKNINNENAQKIHHAHCDLLKMIVDVMIYNRLYLDIQHPLGNCYRIDNHDSFTITLVKYLPFWWHE